MGLRESAIRFRIERILSGSKDPHEIAQIFADVRFLGCPQEVRDLADFSAHRPEKDRGRLLEKTSKLFQQLRLHLQGRSSLHVEAAYTDEQVANALSSFCVAVAIFQPSELTDISGLKMMIALYGLASIHGCVFQEMDGSKQTPLTIRNSAGRLEIGCTVPIAPYGVVHPQVSQIFISMPAFATSLGLDRTIGRLNADLLSPSSATDPGTSIEITDDFHLRYLE